MSPPPDRPIAPTEAPSRADDPGALTPLRDLQRFERRFSAGEVIFERGSCGACMYVVIEGEVAIRTRAEAAGTLLTTLVPGACFGEIALVDQGVRTAAAVALSTPTRLVEIDKARFVYLVSQQPAFALTVLRGLARRLEALTTDDPSVPPETAP